MLIAKGDRLQKKKVLISPLVTMLIGKYLKYSFNIEMLSTTFCVNCHIEHFISVGTES